MKYFIIAGEASGDLHASALMKELKQVDSSAEFCFLGGDLMIAQGGKLVRHYRDMAFMGYIAVLLNIFKVVRNIISCKQAILDFNPDVLILVDYPSFNLRMAKFAKKHTDAKVCYYISPKVWVWKEYRVRDIKKYIDKMYCIFPFEVDFYAKHGYSVEYVGNPTVDSVSQFQTQYKDISDFCSVNNLESKPILALLCGSRKQEITACLPRMVEAAKSFADFQVVIAGAPGVELSLYNRLLNGSNVQVIFNQTYELLNYSTLAVVNSGTATLETALLGTPQVVVYHVGLGKFAYFVKTSILKIKYISLVNIVARKEIVKELIAHLFTSYRVKHEMRELIYDQQCRSNMCNDYSILKNELGGPGAASRTALKIFQFTNI